MHILKIAEGCEQTLYLLHYSVHPWRTLPFCTDGSRSLQSGTEIWQKPESRELILVAQETTLYGIDLYGKKSLHDSAE